MSLSGTKTLPSGKKIDFAGPPLFSKAGRTSEKISGTYTPNTSDSSKRPTSQSRQDQTTKQSRSSSSTGNRAGSSISQNVLDTLSALSKQDRKRPKIQGSSAFLAPSRDSIIPIEIKNSKEMPGVGHYTPQYGALDTEKNLALSGFFDHTSMLTTSKSAGGTQRPHMVNRGFNDTQQSRLRPDSRQTVQSGDSNYQQTHQTFTTTPAPSGHNTRRAERSKSTLEVTRSRGRLDQATASPSGPKTLRQSAASLSSRTEPESAAFRSTTNPFPEWHKKSDCKNDFYVTHDTGLEFLSGRTSSQARSFSSLGRELDPKGRHVGQTFLDRLYDAEVSPVRPRKLCGVTMSKTTSREQTNDPTRLQMADLSYNPKIEARTSSKKTVNVSLNHTLSSGYISFRIKPPVVMNSTPSEARFDAKKAEEFRTTRRLVPSIGAVPGDEPDLARQPKPRKYSPFDTVDDAGNPLPPEVYDVSIEAVRPRHDYSTRFEMAGLRPGVTKPLTADLDYNPDVTAGIAANPSQISVTDPLGTGEGDATIKSRSFGGTSSQTPQLAKSLVQEADRVRENREWRRQMRMKNREWNSQSLPGETTESAETTSSPKTDIAVSMVASTLIGTPQNDFTLTASGQRRHITTARLSDQTSREQWDDTRFHDKPLDKFYTTNELIQSNKARLVQDVNLKRKSGREHDPAGHMLNRPPMNDLIYEPKDDLTHKSVRNVNFVSGSVRDNGMFGMPPPRPKTKGLDGKIIVSAQEEMLSASVWRKNPDDVPFYDVNQKWTKPTLREVSIAPPHEYG
ncbi:hypothetical protein BLNAU_664 [Blattamonas nauphoetae]|uniref:Uncharacterized protein n=1 Tax=Blattamonas nauphoetae TaxID=2049346 RepID=A0ABQ9YK73_9EUKA|nr:hypothetical protein BLNAU_664 [Blattamonas nauphoetae]